MGELQERITSTKKGSVTSVQAIYVPADDLTDPAPATTFAHLDATTVLSRALTEIGIYPAVDPLASSRAFLTLGLLGTTITMSRRWSRRRCRLTKICRTSLPFWHRRNLGGPEGNGCSCAKDSKVPLAAVLVAEQFTGTPGRYVKIADTVKGFGEFGGKYDGHPGAGFLHEGNDRRSDGTAEKMKGRPRRAVAAVGR